MAKISFANIARTVSAFAEISVRTALVAKGFESLPSELQTRIREILAEQGKRTWDTKGGEIGANWGQYDLVDTGELRASMTDPSRIEVSGYGVRYEVHSDVEYAKYVNERWGRIYGLSNTTKTQLEETIRHWILTGKIK